MGEFFRHFKESGYEPHFYTTLTSIGKNEVPYHLIGMYEQLICAESNLFVGTRLSTFSSYIMRLRGYTPGLANKGIFYGDVRYKGNVRDWNEAKSDTTNTMMGGGELAYFREPRNVWVM